MGWLVLSLFMFLPITLITAKRLQILSPESAGISWFEALKLILSASVLNLVLPSKMGDIAKAYFIAEKGRISGSTSLSLMIYEKSCDMLSLMLWCILGLMVYNEKNMLVILLSLIVVSAFVFGILFIVSPGFFHLFFRLFEYTTPNVMGPKIHKIKKSWSDMCALVLDHKPLMCKIALISIFIWFLHLLQIWFFINMLNNQVPFMTHLALAPLAIFVGLLPLTLAGIGTRDAALIYFYQGYLLSSAAAALGILCTSRYIIPAICGIPFFNEYLVKIRRVKPKRV